MKLPGDTPRTRAERLERKIMSRIIHCQAVLELHRFGGGGFDAESYAFSRRLYAQHGYDAAPDAAYRVFEAMVRAHRRLRLLWTGSAEPVRVI